MALLINDECIACDACREECPTTAIEEGDPIYYIDPKPAIDSKENLTVISDKATIGMKQFISLLQENL